MPKVNLPEFTGLKLFDDADAETVLAIAQAFNKVAHGRRTLDVMAAAASVLVAGIRVHIPAADRDQAIGELAQDLATMLGAMATGAGTLQ